MGLHMVSSIFLNCNSYNLEKRRARLAWQNLFLVSPCGSSLSLVPILRVCNHLFNNRIRIRVYLVLSIIKMEIYTAVSLSQLCYLIASLLFLLLLCVSNRYRRSYDSDFTAPLVFYHVWPALMENDNVVMKGEAVTKRGAFVRWPCVVTIRPKCLIHKFENIYTPRDSIKEAHKELLDKISYKGEERDWLGESRLFSLICPQFFIISWQ